MRPAKALAGERASPSAASMVAARRATTSWPVTVLTNVSAMDSTSRRGSGRENVKTNSYRCGARVCRRRVSRS